MLSPLTRQTLFSIDTRSLAAFRICAGLILLFDVASRLAYVQEHYSDQGILPRSDLRALLYPLQTSLYLLDGSSAWSSFLLILSAIFAFLLLVGWKTKLATIASWLMLLWLHNRMPLLQQRGDDLLRLLLFWSMFLPLGASWSLDSRRHQSGYFRIHGAASAGILLQVLLVYFTTVWYRDLDSWFLNAEAGGNVLQTGYFTSCIASAFHANAPAWLLVLSTRAVILLEVIVPIVCLISKHTALLRTIAVFLMFGMHFGFQLFLYLGNFSFICMAAWLLFLPCEFWERLRTTSNAAPSLASLRFASPLNNVISGILLAYIFCFNIWAYFVLAPTGWLATPAYALRIDQRWSMFAGRFDADPSWFTLIGYRASGDRVLLFPKDYNALRKRPNCISADFPTFRFRRYLNRLREPANDRFREPFLKYYCHQGPFTRVSYYMIKESEYACPSGRAKEKHCLGEASNLAQTDHQNPFLKGGVKQDKYAGASPSSLRRRLIASIACK